jgi:hypothetical protein
MRHFELVCGDSRPSRELVDLVNERAYETGAAVRGFGLYFVETVEQQDELTKCAGAHGAELKDAEVKVQELKNAHLLRTHIAKTTQGESSWRHPREAGASGWPF